MKKVIKKGEADISHAVEVLQQGGVVAFPTETYYGLGVDPFNRNALQRLYKLKKRAKKRPILVLVEGISQCGELALLPLPLNFCKLAGVYWPGPLTLVWRSREGVPEELTGQSGTIGMRQSSNPIAQSLVKQFGKPVTATSANISGHAAACCAEEVESIFAEKVDYILDGGPTPGGKGSSLIKCTPKGVECLREGVVDFQEIRNHLS